jgi:sodium-dependent dicarboxylate transporter 2/3/5
MASVVTQFMEARSKFTKLFIVFLTLLVSASVYFFLPDELDELPRRMVVIMIIAAIFWATEVIPLFATSFCVIGIQILFLAADGGIVSSGEQVITSSMFFESLGSSVIILFMGGFLLAQAISLHGADVFLAERLLRPVIRSPYALVCAVMGITAFLSMWMSNTATTAMMLAVITPLVSSSRTDPSLVRSLILAVPVGANIGGIGTPIGTPPNAVALAMLRQSGYEISFLDWMKLAVPLELLLLTISAALLCLLYRPKLNVDLLGPGRAIKLSLKGKMSLLVLGAAIALWLTSGLHGIADAAVAVLAAAVLTALGIIKRKDINSIDWNIIILMWGGLSLGQGMLRTGLLDFIVQQPLFLDLTGVRLASMFVLSAVGLSTLMSNTAAANLLVPVAMAMSAIYAAPLAILTALSCSLAMALPVSTPPNAIAFSTEKISASSLLLVGGVISVIAIISLLLGFQIMIPLILGEI